jgi:hypothetical protein
MRLFTEIIEDNIRELIPDFPRAAITAETIVGASIFQRVLGLDRPPQSRRICACQPT